MWLVAGFVFPFLTPATTLLSEGLERYLTAAAGMPDELADRVAFTIVRIPVTALLGILVAAVQCAVLRGVRPLARRWIIAAAVGACISTLIWLPSTLVALEITGKAFETIRVFLLPPGAALFGGLVSFAQWRAIRRHNLVPGWFVAVSTLSAALGASASAQVNF